MISHCPTVVTFYSGQMSAVPISDDSTLENTEMFTFQLSATNIYVVLGDDIAAIEIVDNDGTCVYLTFVSLSYIRS